MHVFRGHTGETPPTAHLRVLVQCFEVPPTSWEAWEGCSEVPSPLIPTWGAVRRQFLFSSQTLQSYGLPCSSCLPGLAPQLQGIHKQGNQVQC